jgi:hypothetical protein
VFHKLASGLMSHEEDHIKAHESFFFREMERKKKNQVFVFMSGHATVSNLIDTHSISNNNLGSCLIFLMMHVSLKTH